MHDSKKKAKEKKKSIYIKNGETKRFERERSGGRVGWGDGLQSMGHTAYYQIGKGGVLENKNIQHWGKKKGIGWDGSVLGSGRGGSEDLARKDEGEHWVWRSLEQSRTFEGGCQSVAFLCLRNAGHL